MKYIIILADGMADRPIKSLDNLTPMMAANIPAMDMLATKGRVGIFQTIPEGMPTGSAVANLSVLGYDPKETFHGRGVLEAASMGIKLHREDLAMRVNLASHDNNILKSHSSGHISDEEAAGLVKDLNIFFKNYDFKIHVGLSYRHLLVLPGGNDNLECYPPHDNIGKDINTLKVKALAENATRTADILNKIVSLSTDFLSQHPINKKREADNKLAANILWPWSPGKKPDMKTFKELYDINGAVISAVDLIKGLGVYAGLEIINVEGATGLYNTNYEGKADAAIETLKSKDFVFVHVEAADEAGHEKNLELKINCIEDIDQRLLQRIIDKLGQDINNTTIAVLPDHATPVEMGSHTREAVPVLIYDPNKEADEVKVFDEESVKTGSLGYLKEDQFIKTVFNKL